MYLNAAVILPVLVVGVLPVYVLACLANGLLASARRFTGAESPLDISMEALAINFILLALSSIAQTILFAVARRFLPGVLPVVPFLKQNHPVVRAMVAAFEKEVFQPDKQIGPNAIQRPLRFCLHSVLPSYVSTSLLLSASGKTGSFGKVLLRRMVAKLEYDVVSGVIPTILASAAGVFVGVAQKREAEVVEAYAAVVVGLFAGLILFLGGAAYCSCFFLLQIGEEKIHEITAPRYQFVDDDWLEHRDRVLDLVAQKAENRSKLLQSLRPMQVVGFVFCLYAALIFWFFEEYCFIWTSTLEMDVTVLGYVVVSGFCAGSLLQTGFSLVRSLVVRSAVQLRKAELEKGGERVMMHSAAEDIGRMGYPLVNAMESRNPLTRKLEYLEDLVSRHAGSGDSDTTLSSSRDYLSVRETWETASSCYAATEISSSRSRRHTEVSRAVYYV